MNKRLVTFALVFIVGLAFGLSNSVIAGNLPETPITKILNYKSGLGLSDTQAKQLSLINNNIINKMLQAKSQAHMHKSTIDQMSEDWAKLDNPKVKSAVKEYYNCQADIKTLEMEAMAQASQILSKDQIKKFNELVSIELIMINMEKEMVSAY